MSDLKIEKPKLALQTWTVRKELQVRTEETLRQIREIGFEHLELAGNAGRSAEELSSMCGKSRLKVIGIHQPPITSEGKLDDVIDEIKLHSSAYGTKYVTVMLDPDDRGRKNAYHKYAKLCLQAGKKLKEKDITLCYHCYHYDLAIIGNGKGLKSGLDILLEETSAEHLAFELDTYFMHKSTCEFEPILEKCGRRCKLVHVNDCDTKGKQAPLGEGVIQWIKWIKAFRTCCAPDWFILEHDSSEPLSWVKRSCSYWNEMILQ